MATKATTTTVQTKPATPKKKRVNKTWEAAMRLKGSLIINDPTLLL